MPASPRPSLPRSPPGPSATNKTCYGWRAGCRVWGFRFSHGTHRRRPPWLGWQHGKTAARQHERELCTFGSRRGEQRTTKADRSREKTSALTPLSPSARQTSTFATLRVRPRVEQREERDTAASCERSVCVALCLAPNKHTHCRAVRPSRTRGLTSVLCWDHSPLRSTPPHSSSSRVRVVIPNSGRPRPLWPVPSRPPAYPNPLALATAYQLTPASLRVRLPQGLWHHTSHDDCVKIPDEASSCAAASPSSGCCGRG